MSKEMDLRQKAIYWAWYRSGLNGHNGKRSLKRTAAALGLEYQLIQNWSSEFKWAEMAAAEDERLKAQLDELEETEIINDFQNALARQRKFAALLYDKLEKKLADMPPKEIGLNYLFRLMTYELNFIFNESRGGQEPGEALHAVMAAMPPELRTMFHKAVEEMRDGCFAPAGSRLEP